MSARKRRRDAAFTLIEVLLASVLAATLFVAIGMLLSMCSKMFDTGQTKIEQSQLVRSLLAQLSDDLHGVVQPPPPSSPAPLLAPATFGGSSNSSDKSVFVTSSLRPSGLFGTENQLQIDILQAMAVSAEAERPESAPPGALAPSRTPELRTVVYSFQESRDVNPPRGEPRMGLTRRELDWEQAHPAPRGTVGQRSQRERVNPDARGSAAGPRPLDPRAEAGPDNATASVPEVVGFALRYYDGTTWSNQWDSVTRKGLPAAVEVAVQLRLSAESESHHSLVDDSKIKQPKLPVYRLLIHLPSPVQQQGGNPGLRNGPGTRGAARPLEAASHGEFR